MPVSTQSMHSQNIKHIVLFSALALGSILGCTDNSAPIPQDIFADLGEALPSASSDELATFQRGKELMQMQFLPSMGLGTQFNASSCVACHEKPVLGGSAGRYRNFHLVGKQENGEFVRTGVNGIQQHFTLADSSYVKTDIDTTIIATRNPPPFFGMGLIDEIYEEEILKHVDEDDHDGDGISGRANYETILARGSVLSRFGRKAQSASIETFIRSPLFNHVGITSGPLSSSLKDALPRVSPEGLRADVIFARLTQNMCHTLPRAMAQGLPISGSGALRDDDGIRDPELSPQDLFSLVSASMLMAAPRPAEHTEASKRGERLFKKLHCATCHVPTLESPRGSIPLYSDLLIHDMGEEMADGIVMGEAGGAEFRTQPLWGITATAPYLHDGRADTLDEAIRYHGGEAKNSREAYEALSDNQRSDVIAFLESLGGGTQRSEGLLPPDAPIPSVGEFGGPLRPLTADEEAAFQAGRALFDRDLALSEGIGPEFNGDSCRACHFLPVLGGSGPIDVNVMRQGIESSGAFTVPSGGSMLRRFTSSVSQRPSPHASANIFEHRQTPPLFGLGLIDDISEDTIKALADPDDLDNDHIRGIAHILGDGRLGRFGWKADIPSVKEFTRDALSNELGITVPPSNTEIFGFTSDEDDIADPEMGPAAIASLEFFMKMLGAPPRATTQTSDEAAGEALFSSIGCDKCHTPELPTQNLGPAKLYSDLLLHDVAPENYKGVPAGDASYRHFRTPPLWGIGKTAPYMHDGRASTLDAAIQAHKGEAEEAGVTPAYLGLSATQKAQLEAFLRSL